MESLFDCLPGDIKRLPCVDGSLFVFIYCLSTLLTSNAFADTNAKYGIPLSRYTVFEKLLFRATLQ